MLGKSAVYYAVTVITYLFLLPAIVFAGSGSVSRMEMIAEIPEMAFLVAGDLNGNGRTDLAGTEVVWSRDKDVAHVFKLLIFFQQETGFSAVPDKSIDLPCTPSGLLLGDFNGDGQNDLVAGLRPQRSIAVYPGADGFDKVYLSQYNNDSGGWSLDSGRIALGGNSDFMTGAAWRRWMGEEKFSSSYFSGPEQNDNFRSTLADLNWNGFDDIIFTTRDNRIRIYYGPIIRTGILGVNDAFDVVTIDSPFSNMEKPVLQQVFTGDVNGDGQPDFIVGAPDSTLVYFQNSPIGFTEGAGPSLVLDAVTPLLVEDLAGDGLCDLVLREADGRNLLVWQQTKGNPLSAGYEEFAERINFPRAVRAIAADQPDGNGKRRLYVSLAGDGMAVVLF